MRITSRGSVRLYGSPGDLYTWIDTVSPGMQLTVMRTEGPWVDVSFDGGNHGGWIYVPALSRQNSGTPRGTISPQSHGWLDGGRHRHRLRERWRNRAQ